MPKPKKLRVLTQMHTGIGIEYALRLEVVSLDAAPKDRLPMPPTTTRRMSCSWRCWCCCYYSCCHCWSVAPSPAAEC